MVVIGIANEPALDACIVQSLADRLAWVLLRAACAPPTTAKIAVQPTANVNSFLVIMVLVPS